MCNEKFNENYLSAKARLYKNLKSKSSSPDPDSLLEEIKHVQLQFHGWLNAFKATSTLLNSVALPNIFTLIL